MRVLRPFLITAVLFPGLVSSLAAQGPYKDDPALYAAEPMVILHSDSAYAMKNDGTGTRTATFAVRVQSDAALRDVGVVSIPYAGNSEHVDFVYVRVRRPDGTTVETPTTEALDVPAEVTRVAPFYSDLKQRQLPVRNLRVGDTLEWEVRVVRTVAEAPGEFWGSEARVDEGVMLESSLELTVPAGRTVTVWSPGIKPSESEAAGMHTYRWDLSQVKRTAGKDAEAERAAKKTAPWTAAQELDEQQGKLPALAWTTFKDWSAVGAWYRGLEADRSTPSPEIKARVAELTAGKTSEEEKARAIYAYVATQLRYIGVAFGIGRYQPHVAADVLSNQYGDCKDKHTLLAAMLAAAGIHSDAVLIGAGIRFNQAVPSPASFNHLITLAQVDGKPAWLDATTEVAPYRMLSEPTRDRMALVVPDAGAARIEKTPAELPFKPFTKMEAVATIDAQGISESHIVMTLRGDPELLLRSVMRQLPPARYDELVQRLVAGMGYGGTTSHPVLSRAEDTTQPLTIAFDYHREKAGDDWEHLRTVMQLAPLGLPVIDEKEPPVRDMQLGQPRVETSTSSIKLPEGWGAELPEAVHQQSPWLKLDTTYRMEKGTLYAERTMQILKPAIAAADWKAYKKFTDASDINSVDYVQLTRGKVNGRAKDAVESAAVDKLHPGAARHGADEAASMSAEKAATLIRDAYNAVNGNDLKKARKLLDQAKSYDPALARLWSTYGFIAFRSGEFTEALADYEKELALYPDATGVYRDMAGANMMLNKPAAARDILHRWAAAEPENPAPTGMLVAQLISEGDGTGALQAAEAGFKRLPEDVRKSTSVQTQLGEAQIKAGEKVKGGSTVAAALKGVDNPMLLNNAAYVLAEGNVELPQAESSARMALKTLGDESKTWTLDENSAMLRGQSTLIIATWDTLGWVLYREGKLTDAEQYLQAAWRNGPSLTTGEHLGEVEAAEGKLVAAAQSYRLALSAAPQSTMFTGRQLSDDPRYVRLRKRLEDLDSSGKDSAAESSAALQKMRVLPLGSAGGRNGAAEYKVLISSAGVTRVEPAGEKSLAGGAALIKSMDVRDLVPRGSEERIVRAGILNCHSGKCEFVLEP